MVAKTKTKTKTKTKKIKKDNNKVVNKSQPQIRKRPEQPQEQKLELGKKLHCFICATPFHEKNKKTLRTDGYLTFTNRANHDELDICLDCRIPVISFLQKLQIEKQQQRPQT